jgi:hypothetical protein
MRVVRSCARVYVRGFVCVCVLGCVEAVHYDSAEVMPM